MHEGKDLEVVSLWGLEIYQQRMNLESQKMALLMREFSLPDYLELGRQLFSCLPAPPKRQLFLSFWPTSFLLELHHHVSSLWIRLGLLHQPSWGSNLLTHFADLGTCQSP